MEGGSCPCLSGSVGGEVLPSQAAPPGITRLDSALFLGIQAEIGRKEKEEEEEPQSGASGTTLVLCPLLQQKLEFVALGALD